jgi:integrase
MGLYLRKDSPFWWMRLERYDKREATAIPHQGASPEQTRELKRQALDVYNRRMAQLALDHPKDAKPVVSYRTLSRWYEDHHAAHLRGASRVCSMLRQLAKYFSRFTDVSTIRASDIQEWMTWRKHQVSPSTVNRELDTLKSVLKAGVPRYLEASPASELRRFRVAEAERRVLTQDEEARILAVASPADRAWVMLAIDTLLRLTSTLELKWAQVKLDRGVIVPLNAKVSHDAVPISDRLAAALRALPREGDYVFPQFRSTPRGGPSAARNAAIRRFASLCHLAGVDHGREVDGVTFHCLRHTGATRALQRGASVRTVMKLGGWKDERMVMQYVHASDADVRAAANSIGVGVASHVTETASRKRQKRAVSHASQGSRTFARRTGVSRDLSRKSNAN